MVLGFRVSYHNSQIASAQGSRTQPICPCAACFNGTGEHETLRAACDAPAREIRTSSGHHASLNPFSGLTSSSDSASGSGRTKSRLGFGLMRRRSVDTMASDMRPLRQSGQDVPVDEQSLVEEKNL